MAPRLLLSIKKRGVDFTPLPLSISYQCFLVKFLETMSYL